MSSRGETREQPSIPDPPELRVEHAGLAVTLVALTVAVGALAVESVTHLALLRRGAYSVLAALIVVGVVTYFGVRILRELAELRAGQRAVRGTLRKVHDQADPLAPEAEAALQRIGIKLLHGGRAGSN